MATEEMCRLSAWIPERQRQMLDRIAAEHDRSVNYLIRVAIQQFLDSPSVISQLDPRQGGPRVQQ